MGGHPGAAEKFRGVVFALGVAQGGFRLYFDFADPFRPRVHVEDDPFGFRVALGDPGKEEEHILFGLGARPLCARTVYQSSGYDISFDFDRLNRDGLVLELSQEVGSLVNGGRG